MIVLKHGALHLNNKRVGGYKTSDISTLALSRKNLGAYGDAGIITTSNLKLSQRIRKIRNIGASTKFNHELIGYNNRLDTLQASILIHKIDLLDKLNKKGSEYQRDIFRN